MAIGGVLLIIIIVSLLSSNASYLISNKDATMVKEGMDNADTTSQLDSELDKKIQHIVDKTIK
jgi:hypothetical protein